MEIKKVLVIGAGTMGRGIAQWFLQQGISVHLTDSIIEFANKSKTMIHESLDMLLTKEKISLSDKEAFSKNIEVLELSAIDKDYDLVIEAIIEDLRIKTELFLSLDQKLDEKTIIASNTSSIPITRLARNLSIKRKEKFLGLHFFNPATIMKLVEIIETPWSDHNLSKNLYNFFVTKGKKPAMCKDYPGFIVNRVARNFYGESLHQLKEFDRQKIQEIDHVMKEVGGFKMGPFELMDLIGIDINYDVTVSVWNSYYNEARFRPHRIQREMVESGRIGKKANEGFYKYEK